jgi:Cof subfamily protein (haloacid dehalogenase superfamily)
MIQLVALDLDGTLMGADLVISPRVRGAIARAIQRGVIVTLATGRMFSATAPFARTLGIDAPLICYQGGWIQGLATEILHRVALPDNLARQAIAMGHSTGWHTILYADGQLFVDSLRHPRIYYEKFLGPDPTEVPELALVLDEHQPDKVLFIAEPQEIAGMAAELTGCFGTSADIVQSHSDFIEIVPRNVNKGQALAWLAAREGVPPEAVLAVGDQYNDQAMLTWAGIGVAMGNAVSAVQAIADWIAPALEDDGAAAALERFALTAARVPKESIP